MYLLHQKSGILDMGEKTNGIFKTKVTVIYLNKV